MEDRVKWVDVARGGSIIFVIILHCTMFLKAHSGFDLRYFDQLNIALSPIRMPLFFAISGVLASRALTRKWLEIIAGRVWPLIYFFGLWSVIRWAYFRYVQENAVTPIEGNSFIELAWMWIQPNSGLWFLWCLAIYLVIAKAALRFKVPALSLSLIAALLTWNGYISPGNYVHHNAIVYLPFFLIGAWFGHQAVALVEKWPLLSAATASLIFLGVFLMRIEPSSHIYGFARLLASFAGLTVGALVSMLIAKSNLLRSPLVYIGSRTLPVYVTHVLIVSLVADILSSIVTHRIEWWGVPALMAIAITASLLIEALVKTCHLRFIYDAPKLLQQKTTPPTMQIGSHRNDQAAASS